MLIIARKNLGDALRPVLNTPRVIKRCIRRCGVWIVYAE